MFSFAQNHYLSIIKKKLYCYGNDDFLNNTQISALIRKVVVAATTPTFVCESAVGNREGKGKEALVFSADGRGSRESWPWSNCRIASS